MNFVEAWNLERKFELFLGGIMVDSFSWHYVFFLGMPLSAAAFVLAILFLPGRRQAVEPRCFDWLGFVGGCLVAAIFVLALLPALLMKCQFIDHLK